eukprot:320148_1
MAEAAKKLVTYDQLANTQRCIYQAFTKLDDCKDKEADMAKWVNQQGYDADSEHAVLILARKYGLVTRYGGMGTEMAEIGFENNEEVIFIISLDNNTANALKQKFGSELNENVDKMLLYFPDAKFHAIYGRAKGKKITWTDDQQLRKKGPLKDDYFVYFATK